MKVMTKAPQGAMIELELEASTHGTVIYKVWKETTDGIVGKITRAIVESNLGDGRIATTDPRDLIYFSTWFKRERGYLFTNYFHAYAYSLKCKEQARGRGTV